MLRQFGEETRPSVCDACLAHTEAYDVTASGLSVEVWVICEYASNLGLSRSKRLSNLRNRFGRHITHLLLERQKCFEYIRLDRRGSPRLNEMGEQLVPDGHIWTYRVHEKTESWSLVPETRTFIAQRCLGKPTGQKTCCLALSNRHT